jgi:hypothetical protein
MGVAELIATADGPVTWKSLPFAATVLQNIGSVSWKSMNVGVQSGGGIVPIAMAGCGGRVKAVVLAAGIILPQSPTRVFASEPLTTLNV